MSSRTVALLVGLALATACDRSPAKPPETCPELSQALASELARLQSCTADSECGKPVPTFGSCGCTYDHVVRKDADTAAYEKLYGEMQAKECAESGLMGICDCKPSSGFGCSAGKCAWKMSGTAGGLIAN